jgi:hypothetical protein
MILEKSMDKAGIILHAPLFILHENVGPIRKELAVKLFSIC